MKSRRYSKKDSVFSWNDQSTDTQMVLETGRKINIRIYEKNRNSALRSRSKKRARSLPYNAYTKNLNTRYLRQLRFSVEINPEKMHSLIEGRIKISRELIIQRFKNVVAKVLLLRSIFRRLFSYAMENGQHDKITSDPRMRLKGHQPDLNPDKDILFDPERFKIDFQGFFPKWAKNITRKAPGDRTEEEIDSLVKLLKQLKEFRRYTHKTQRLLSKVVRYDRHFPNSLQCPRNNGSKSRFERHRVVIRKGHVGRRFYIIFSGRVCFTLSEDDHDVFTRPTDYYNLYKGDAFGELALLRGVRRTATIVCLKRTEFLSVEKEEFNEMGIVDILRSEMDSRVAFLRSVDLFATWPVDVVRKVAEESRSLEFLNDTVIDRNLIMSDMMYIVMGGKCHVLRLLDLTNNKKWAKLRRQQKTLYTSAFPESISSPSSRQGTHSRLTQSSRRGTISRLTASSRQETCSRLSASSNVTVYPEAKITRLLSDPQLPGKTPRSELLHTRMVKSAFTRTAGKFEERSGSDRKHVQMKTASSHAPRGQEIKSSDRVKTACSKTQPERSNFGIGVFLRLDIIEKGEIASVHGIQRTGEGMLPTSTTNTRRLPLVSKGCQIISIPVEVIKKHADVETLQKVEKQVKKYPNDEELLNCYLEKSNWNTYKEILLSKKINEIEKRKSLGKPGTMLKTNPATQHNKHRYTLQRPETRETIHARTRSVASRRESTLDNDKPKCPRSLSSPSPLAVKSNDHSMCYTHKPSEMMYAQGSHRNLVLVNGGIRTNAIQEELEGFQK